MEKIKTLEELRMQRDLLQLQQMIAELRMKKDFYELRSRVKTRNILPTLGGLMKAGIKTPIGKQFLFLTAGKLVKRFLNKKRKSSY